MSGSHDASCLLYGQLERENPVGFYCARIRGENVGPKGEYESRAIPSHMYTAGGCGLSYPGSVVNNPRVKLGNSVLKSANILRTFAMRLGTSG
jgi:hypothetical protein